MGLEWHQFFSLVPATNKSNAMIDLTPNTLHCDSWWHSGYRNENNHTTSNPLFLKHHFGHFFAVVWHLTAPHMTYPEPHHAMLPTNSSEGSPFHANAQMSSISSKSSMKRLDSRDSSWVKILVLVPGTVVNTKVAGKTWMCITPSSGIIGLKWFEPVSTNICQWVYICINMWIYKYIII